MVLRMIHIRDSLLPFGKVWSLDCWMICHFEYPSYFTLRSPFLEIYPWIFFQVSKSSKSQCRYNPYTIRKMFEAWKPPQNKSGFLKFDAFPCFCCSCPFPKVKPAPAKGLLLMGFLQQKSISSQSKLCCFSCSKRLPESFGMMEIVVDHLPPQKSNVTI